jgi:hypothetical protein
MRPGSSALDRARRGIRFRAPAPAEGGGRRSGCARRPQRASAGFAAGPCPAVSWIVGSLTIPVFSGMPFTRYLLAILSDRLEAAAAAALLGTVADSVYELGDMLSNSTEILQISILTSGLSLLLHLAGSTPSHAPYPEGCRRTDTHHQNDKSISVSSRNPIWSSRSALHVWRWSYLSNQGLFCIPLTALGHIVTTGGSHATYYRYNLHPLYCRLLPILV